jgi:hypothetical protein
MGRQPEHWVGLSENVHAISDYAANCNVQDPGNDRQGFDIFPGIHRCSCRDPSMVLAELDIRLDTCGYIT